jgi:hypothetical protein
MVVCSIVCSALVRRRIVPARGAALLIRAQG